MLPPAVFESKTAANRKFHFVLKATNVQIIGTNQMYKAEASCSNDIDSGTKNAPGATTDDQTA